jgi:hypothetical protein
MAARGFLGAGDLYIAAYVAGVKQPYEGPFECRKFEIKPNSELKELVSKGRSTYGQVIESVPVPKPADLTVELSEVNNRSLSIAMFGTSAALTQAAGAVSDAVTLVLDRWVPLTKGRLNPAVPVTIATLVEGTDFIVNYTLGWVKALNSGAAGARTVAGTALAIDGQTISGMTQTQVRVGFLLDGKNFVDDLPTIVEVYEAIISAESAVDFLADDFNTVTLPGRMKTPTGFLTPFTIKQRTAA